MKVGGGESGFLLSHIDAVIVTFFDSFAVTHVHVSRALMTCFQTRVSDWREGGLGSDFLLRKLRAAAAQMSRYESSAAPAGWSCHWDRCVPLRFSTNHTSPRFYCSRTV